MPVFALGLFCAVMAPGTGSTETAPGPTPVEFQKMAVMPFFVGSRVPNVDETVDATLTCPVSEICADAPDIPAGTGAKVTRMVHEELRIRFGPQLCPLEQTDAAFAAVSLEGEGDTPRALTRKLGRALGADLVVVGTLWRYRDRGALSGLPDSPASVAFALYLVDVDSGQRLWRMIFDRTQRPATENVFQAGETLKMGLKWLSADELARFGVRQALNHIPAMATPMDAP